MQHTRHHIGRWRSNVEEDASIMVKKSNIHFWEMDMWHITNQKFNECLLSITSVPRAVLGAGIIAVKIAESLSSRIHVNRENKTNKL